ncbi:MAG: hypothetical protein ACRELB_15260, partial [Polyangiaceae bacterium]
MSLLAAGARFMTAGTGPAGRPVRPTRAPVHIVPPSAALMPGPDHRGPASVPSSGASVRPSGARVGEEDSPDSSGLVPACDADAGAPPSSGTYPRVSAAI